MTEELKTIDTVDMSPFKKMVMTIGELPTSFVESMSYYEALAWLANYIEKQVIPAVNNNAEALEELQTAFVTLKNYVDNYFDNLDVQEEINNKLDEMADDGTLQEIITTYIQANTPWTFNTVADMKLAENFIDGSYAQTLGYHTYNDGGASLYKIRTVTNSDVVDEATIIALHDDTLVAELIVTDHITPEQFGAYGDNIHDDTLAVQACLDNTTYMHAVLSKEYKITSPLTAPDYKYIDGGGAIYSTGTCFVFDGKNHLTVKDLRLYPQLHGIHIKSTTAHSNYNLFDNIFCYGADTADSKGLFIEVIGSYINEFTYRNCVFWNFKYGIYALNDAGSYEMNKHTFYNCSTETSKTAGQYIKNGNEFCFFNCRHTESISLKFITEGECRELLIVGGTAWYNSASNTLFSENTTGQIYGGLRYAGIGVSAGCRNAYIVSGKVVPMKDGINTARKNVSSDLTISYGQEIFLYYNFNSNTANHTLTLPSECYGGWGKINEFFVRTAKADYTSTVAIGGYSKSLAAGTHTYRFTLNTLEGGTSWFVEQLS